ncbi:Cytochrome c [Geoalkalibacter ferrihydriticus]|uniref:Cytochrome C n=2 Tax=Geoalkalibacter ferrihydriticus TaxID=392333 RepID=A0A0C2HM65_9BACT|nr:cytochrome c [Geoalkalibacter ferrihydriticus]KIH78146.1 cytochrome C [Geoalkalibacter ferrihydriticus DSM 17813]SDM81228.1 Cytochrome c [Geoalkalibacter ferrihydriticus]
MRHLLTLIATYIIVLFLVAAAALFAWARSAQLVVTDEATVLARFEPVSEQEFVWSQLGKKAYLRNCANCHGAEGTGWDQYPALGHTAALFQPPNGREYIVDLHLYGLTGERWGAPMPPMGHIHDIEMAAVINHVLTHFGNEALLDEDAELYAPADIGPRRGQELSPAQINARRLELMAPEAD